MRPPDRFTKDGTAPLAGLPGNDPIRAIIGTILDLVPASHWTFARFKGNGDRDQVLSATSRGDELLKAREEFALQSERTAAGPGIGAIRGHPGQYGSGRPPDRATSGHVVPGSPTVVRVLPFGMVVPTETASDRFPHLANRYAPRLPYAAS